VVLFIFGYACPSCIAVAPNVKSKIQDVYGPNSNFVLLGLDQWDGNKAGVESFQSKTGANYPLLQKASGTASLYNSTWDRLIIVDQEGKIAFKGTKLVSSDLNAAISIINNLLLVNDISQIQKDFTIEIFPNPFSSFLQVKINNTNREEIDIAVKNLHGQIILSPNKSDILYNNSYLINLEDISSGLYFVEISIGKTTQTFKIIKQ
jgi:hypothetical protein